MISGRRRFLVLSGQSLLGAGTLAAQSRKTGAPPPPPLPAGLAARLDLANSAGGSVPGGATVIAGSWSVDAGAKKLVVAPEPLVDAWLEFGPELREKGASIVISGRAPGGGRLQSRFGAGLYGKNGFQLRAVAVRQELELVRRGAVLLRRPSDFDPAALLHLELSVRGDRKNWIVSGRAWTEEGQRPGETLFDFKVFAAELLFPLAGRSVLVAAPFSGEPVAFASAAVYHEGYGPDGKLKEAAAP